MGGGLHVGCLTRVPPLKPLRDLGLAGVRVGVGNPRGKGNELILAWEIIVVW
jgi:hypothetical protein